MPDLCDLILDDHETFRRRFAELDEARRAGAGADRLGGIFEPVADLLEVHAAGEEELFYPRLLDRGSDATDETRDAINDHNEIRDAISRARFLSIGADDWWEAVAATRERNSAHMAEEERGALADLRSHAPEGERQALGDRWIRFRTGHAAGSGIDNADKSPSRYIAEHD